MKTIYIFLFCFLSISLFSQTTIYVDSSATGLNDGTSWSDAFNDLQDALDIVVDNDSILVAKGTYYPSEPTMLCSGGTDQDNTFYLNKDFKLIGGYPNGGGIRNWRQFPSLLSGNIGSKIDSTDNIHHIVIIRDTDSTFLFDGFHIKDAYAIGSGACGLLVRTRGGGVYNDGGSGTLRRLYIAHNVAEFGAGLYDRDGLYSIRDSLIITHNHATTSGGGIRTFSGDFLFENCLISSNKASSSAALSITGDRAKFANCIITDNLATNSGVVDFSIDNASLVKCTFNNNIGGHNNLRFQTDSLTMHQCSFKDNSSQLSNGGVIVINPIKLLINQCTFSNNMSASSHLGGALRIQGGGDKNKISNCIFDNNSGGKGGALYAFSCDYIEMINTTFVNNQSSALIANAIYLSSGPMSITNTIFTESNTIDTASNAEIKINYSNIRDNWGGVGNLDTVINFRDSANGDYRLRLHSPCVNAGTNDSLSIGDTLDIDGNARIHNTTVDMGAYEYFVPCASSLTRVFVDASATGENDGSCWKDAYTELYTGIGAADNGDTVLIAEADYHPKPSLADPRSATFTISKKITLLGGFPAGGSFDNDRNTSEYRAVLSGDIGVPRSYQDNLYKVVTVDGPGELTTYMIGIAIRYGSANAMGHLAGGAMHLNDKVYLDDVLIERNISNKNGPISFTSADGFLILNECTLRLNSPSDKFSNLLGSQVEINPGTTIE